MNKLVPIYLGAPAVIAVLLVSCSSPVPAGYGPDGELAWSPTAAATVNRPQETGVSFHRHFYYGKREMDACFFGDFPKTRRNGDTHYGLPITMTVTNKEVRRENDLTGTSERLPGSVRVYRFNPGTDFRYNERLEVTAPFYAIYPWRGNTCMHIGLLNGAPARSGQAFTLTGKFRLRIASAGQFLGGSLWGWKMESFGGRTIWEGMDHFNQICIYHPGQLERHGGRLLRSQGGKRYCYLPPRNFQKLARLG